MVNGHDDEGGFGGRHVPFLELLGIEEASVEKGRSSYELTIGGQHLRTLGILHGGVTATLLDTTMGRAAGTTAPPGHHVVTVQLGMNFIRPGWEGERLRVEGEVVHSGRKTAVARGEIRTVGGDLVATGTATFMYLPHPEEFRDGGEREA